MMKNFVGLLLVHVVIFLFIINDWRVEAAQVKTENTPKAGTTPFVYMHIAKTGGTTLSEAIPLAIGLGKFKKTSCNAIYDIPKCCIPLINVTVRLQKVEWGKRCMFLSHEWSRISMETSLKPLLSSYRVLTSFREPLSHFFSACYHNAIEHSREHRREPYSFEKSVAALKAGKFLPRHYYLRNYQTKFLMNNSTNLAILNDEKNSTYVISLAKEYVKSIYWFSLSEHMTLSLALLQCQVFGSVQSGLLKEAKLLKLNDHVTSIEVFNVTSKILSDIHSLIQTDIFVYEMIAREFWERIDLHYDCLKTAAGEGLYDLR